MPEPSSPPPSAAELVERLAALPTLGELPRAELEWLVEHGRYEVQPEGAVVAPRGRRIEFLWIMLSGSSVIHVDRGAGPRQVMRWAAGAVSGMLPYSRMTGPPGDNVVEETAEMLMVGVEHFAEMVHRCPCFTAHTVHLMLDRARNFNTSDLQDEKMVSLGRLAAGLAHELNNPASATVRSAKLLRDALAEAEAASRELGAVGLATEVIASMERQRGECLAAAGGAVRSPLEQADREDELADWLERRGADPAHAVALADTAVTVDALDRLVAELPAEAIAPVMRWLAARCTVEALAGDVERAATRIHDLVAAVKRFTHMDQLAGPECVEIEPGLRDTLRVVGSKAKGKNATVRIDLDADLPRVRAAGGELNQVWLNLIDNALDAIAAGGVITVAACRRLDRVVVSIVDDGPGIPAKVLPRIFDPFFTTKPPGHGTGLGLDIARRLVRRWDGDLTVESKPGRTEFQVHLETAGGKLDGPGAESPNEAPAVRPDAET